MPTPQRHEMARTLIVDDEDTNVRLLIRILERAGYRHVLGLTDPRAFADRFPTFQPDLVLLALLMPNVDGFTLLKHLSSTGRGDRVPVLVLTADVTPESKRRAFVAGARDYLTKPFDVEEVLLRVRNMLERRHLRSELRQHNEAGVRRDGVR